MAEDIEKIPPQSAEAERSVLGAMMIDINASERGVEMLEPEYFYIPANEIIFRCMRELQARNSPIDVITVTDALRSSGELEKVGGTQYLAELIDSVVTPANFEHHASLVAEKALLRKIIQLCSTTINRAFDTPGDIQQFIDNTESEFFKISEKRLKGDFVHIRGVVQDVHEQILTWAKSDKIVRGVQTGYTKLDSILTGLHPSDYIIIAGRTSTGKTALALSIARNIAITPSEEERKGVAIFSLEMSREQVALRLLSAEAQVNIHHIRQGMLRESEKNDLALKVKRIQNSPIFIDDSPGLTVMEMRAKARRLLKTHSNIGLIIVDYLQLVQPYRQSDNRQEEVASISRALKGLARELNVPVIALSQLSRKVEEKQDFRPRLSHLRESGAIEQDADIVLLLYRPVVHELKKYKFGKKEYDLEKEEYRGITEIIVAKQRNGPTGSVLLFFEETTTNFSSWDYYDSIGEYEAEMPETELGGI